MGRARLRMAGLVVAIIVVVVAVALGSGGSPAPPDSAAAKLVPADALAYVNVSIDPRRASVGAATLVARRLPDFPLAQAAVEARLEGLAGSGAGIDYATQVKPWLGDEAALGLLNTASTTAGSLLLLGVRDEAKAISFLRSSGARPDGRYRSVMLRRYRTGTEVAILGSFVVLGQPASVDAAIDVANGARPSLAASVDYRRAAAGEPADRVIDAYASAAGVQRLLAPQAGLFGALGVVLYQPALTGVTATLSAGGDTARVRVHSALDPTLQRIGGVRSPRFAPSLQHVIPSGSMLMLDVSGLGRVAPGVLRAAAAGGLAGRVGPLLARLGQALHSEGVDVTGALSVFGGETAVAITSERQRPGLLIVARTSHPALARAQLASLESPLQQLFPPASSGAGQAGTLSSQTIDGVTVNQLELEPGLELDYAVEGNLVAVSTGLQAITQFVRHNRSITTDGPYQAVLSAPPARVTSLLYLDFSQLLSLGEQTGLTKSARFRALRADLNRIRAVGLDSTSGEADSTAELYLHIP